MNRTWSLRPLAVYLLLGIPLAASCAREENTADDMGAAPGSAGKAAGGSKSTAGSSGLPTAGSLGSGTAGSSNAFGGTASNGGANAGGATTGGKANGGAAQGGKAGAGGTGGASGGTGGSSTVPPDVIMRADAVVYYETSHSTASDKTIQMKLHIKNQSADPLPMAHVKIRYWFTAEAAGTPHQYYTGPEAKGPMAAIVSAGKDTHVLMTFSGGSIVKGGDMNASEVQLEISSNTDPFNQADDFSWDPSAKTATPNGKVTLYLDDVLVWGCEPSGKCFDDATSGTGGQGAGGDSGGIGTGTAGAGGAP